MHLRRRPPSPYSRLHVPVHSYYHFFFFFNDTATTEIYTLSLHDALPILPGRWHLRAFDALAGPRARAGQDRKSTRLNSSHRTISYAVFCLKKKKLTFNILSIRFDLGAVLYE